MFEKETKIFLEKGNTRICDILTSEEFLSYNTKTKEFFTSYGTASWKEPTPRVVLKLQLYNDVFLLCHSEQKLLVSYGDYGLLVKQAKELIVSNSILFLEEKIENMYAESLEHLYYDQDFGFDDTRHVRSAPIKSIEEILNADLNMFGIYSGFSKIFFANNILVSGN